MDQMDAFLATTDFNTLLRQVILPQIGFGQPSAPSQDPPGAPPATPSGPTGQPNPDPADAIVAMLDDLFGGGSAKNWLDGYKPQKED